MVVPFDLTNLLRLRCGTHGVELIILRLSVHGADNLLTIFGLNIQVDRKRSLETVMACHVRCFENAANKT